MAADIVGTRCLGRADDTDLFLDEEVQVWSGRMALAKPDLLEDPACKEIKPGVDILHHVNEMDSICFNKAREVLPRGFLQVPAADHQCGSRLHRPTPPARRFVCLIGFETITST